MTYSQYVKEELCSVKFSCEDCNTAFVCALLLCRNNEISGALFSCDNKHIVDILTQKIVETTGVIATCSSDQSTHKKHNSFSLFVESRDDIAEFFGRYSKALEWKIDVILVKKPCCRAAFLRGVFLACGVIVNPQKEYHFEFKLHNKKVADEIFEFTKDTGISFKRTKRKANEVIYLKDSEAIEEILTLMGAYKNALDLMNIKIEKELRNKINRANNCDTANISKTVTASMRQIDDINFIISKKGEGFLPEDLIEVARLRLTNPDLSLADLCKVIQSGISRSGLNHRLNRLSKMAEEIRTSY